MARWLAYEAVYGWPTVAARLAASHARYDARSPAGTQVFFLPNLDRWVQIINRGRDQNGPFDLTLHSNCPCGG